MYNVILLERTEGAGSSAGKRLKDTVFIKERTERTIVQCTLDSKGRKERVRLCGLQQVSPALRK